MHLVLPYSPGWKRVRFRSCPELTYLLPCSRCQCTDLAGNGVQRRALLISLAAVAAWPVQQARAGKCVQQLLGPCVIVISTCLLVWKCFSNAAQHLYQLIHIIQNLLMLIAVGFGWDGESAALGSCALGEAGDACRRNVLL